MSVRELYYALDRGRRLLPVVARLSEISEREIMVLAQHPRYKVRLVTVHGKQREFSLPSNELTCVQRVLAKMPFVVHGAAHGYVRGRSVVTNASCHAGAPVVVKCDLHKFFQAVTRRSVRWALGRVGVRKDEIRLFTDLLTNKDSLPQGAPSSPAVANAVLYLLDGDLQGLARRFGAVYTRYVDDLVFSGDLSTVAAKSLIQRVDRVVRQRGYELSDKTSVKKWFQRQTVVGIVVNNGVLRTPREFRKRIRAALHRASIGREQCEVPARVRGWIEYAGMVNPEDKTRLMASEI